MMKRLPRHFFYCKVHRQVMVPLSGASFSHMRKRMCDAVVHHCPSCHRAAVAQIQGERENDRNARKRA
jgi:hypothetical protein